MSASVPDGLVFNDGFVVNRDRVLVASQERDRSNEDVSMVAIVAGGAWKLASLNDAVLSVACDDQNHGFFVGHRGRILVTGMGGRTIEELPYSDELGEFLRVRNIAGRIYVCGMSGQVYMRDGSTWTSIDAGIRGTDQLDFEDIGGAGPADLYAVTSFGSVMHYDGSKWREVDFPDNRPLSGVRALNTKMVFVCGDGGALYRGHGDHWESIGSSDFEFDYWCIEPHGSAVYAAYGGGIVRFESEKLDHVDMGLVGEIDCHRLHSNDGVLYSFGIDHIAYLDDRGAWNRLPCPFNRF
jgi:hypothetical protein